MSTRRMHLIGYLKTGPTGYRQAGWRHPEAPLEFLEPSWYEHAAQVMEAAKFDAVLFADLFGIADMYKGSFATYVEHGGQNSYLDPMSVLPIIARVTSRLGLATTVSTSFFNAFHIARSLASIDVLSKGRVAWNVITSTGDLEAKNAGMDSMPPHGERYDRADEVVEACVALWKTWDENAFVLDKKSGVFADPSKVHYANYVGKWTKTRGPLPTPRSLQGHPVIMQAGSSDRGRDFAARWAEIIFVGGSDESAMREFYGDMHKRIAAKGRDPSKVPIVASVTPIMGETESIAREKADWLESMEHPEYSLAAQSFAVGADLSKHQSADEVLRARGNQGTRGSDDSYKKAAEAGGRDNQDFAKTVAKRRPGIIGTHAMVADRFQELFESRACDGFVIMPTSMVLTLEQFCRGVVPELQRRGIFRTEYRGATLRENLLNP